MAMRRKHKTTTGPTPAGVKRSRKGLDLAYDEQIDSDDEVASMDGETPSYKDEDEESEEENLDVKKVRLARQYLERLDEVDDSDSASDDSDGGDDEMDAIGHKLRRERLKQEGLFERPVADKIEKSVMALQDTVITYHKRQAIPLLPPQEATAAWVEAGAISLLKGHDLTPTCVALQASGEKIVSGSKDHSVLLWDVERESLLESLSPHWRKSGTNSKDNGSFRTNGQILSAACSDDGRFAAVGRRDSTISIFDIRMKASKGVNLVQTFTGHKDAVTCLTFRTQSNQLFSGSYDRCIRHYNLDEMLYIETLYGHQFGITSIDCHRKERPVSVAQDRTARAWKLQEDTHLIFRGGAKAQPADCVSVIKDDWFVTGHQDGILSLWITDKKKAVSSIVSAHGEEGNIGRAISSVASLKGSDVVSTGSNDGYLRFWKVRTGRDSEDRGISALTQIPLNGFINDVALGPKGKICVAAVGQEPRLGRWNRVQKAKNRIAIIHFRQNDEMEQHDEYHDDENKQQTVVDNNNSLSEDSE